MYRYIHIYDFQTWNPAFVPSPKFIGFPPLHVAWLFGGIKGAKVCWINGRPEGEMRKERKGPSEVATSYIYIYICNLKCKNNVAVDLGFMNDYQKRNDHGGGRGRGRGRGRGGGGGCCCCCCCCCCGCGCGCGCGCCCCCCCCCCCWLRQVN